MKRLLYSFVAGLGCISGLATAPSSAAALHELLDTRVGQSCDAFLAKMDRPDPQPTVRDLTACAWALLELGRNPTNAEELVQRAFKLQDMEPHSPNYGTVPWQEGNPGIRDANAIEFTMLPLGPILLRHSAKLSEKFRKEAVLHARAGLEAIRRHNVRATYSNIYLMKVANLLLLGHAIEDTNAIAEAEAAFDVWLAMTRASGVSEYDSPTYTPVQMDCLALAHNLTSRAQLKLRLKAALDFYWADLAANFFVGRQTLVAPASRDYSFLFSDENVTWTYHLAGLRPAPPGRILLSDEIRLWATARLGGYRPPPEVLALATSPERVVRSQFGGQAGQDRYVFITPDFALGSASAYYGPQDKPVCAALASTNKLPVISFVADAFDSPFGVVRMADRSGHRKPWHLQHRLVTVQEKAFLLALFDLSPELKRRDLTNLASSLVLPVNAGSLLLDGRVVDGSKPFSLPAGPDSVVVAREGKAAVAVRLFAADACAGRTPVWQLKYDGNPQGAARLVAYHYWGSERRLEETAVRAGLVLTAGRCETDADFSAFVSRTREIQVRPRMEGSVWRVNARQGTTELEAALDLKEKRIITRRVNGKDWQTAVLNVNGRDLAAEHLGHAVPAQ